MHLDFRFGNLEVTVRGEEDDGFFRWEEAYVVVWGRRSSNEVSIVPMLEDLDALEKFQEIVDKEYESYVNATEPDDYNWII